MDLAQERLARHALGLDGERKRSYRNRFYASFGSADHKAWEVMVAKGWAVKTETTAHMDRFELTLTGAHNALHYQETLDPEDFPPTRHEARG